MAALDVFEDEIKQLVAQNRTHRQISEHIRTTYGVARGASVKSVKVFCLSHGITRRMHIDDTQLDVVVEDAISRVGPSWGRKMMTGRLSSEGLTVAESRVGKSLIRVNPAYHRERQQGMHELNPKPYFAKYYGHKLHLDQNEKLTEFGVTHVIAVDGFSSRIVKTATMPVKNNLTIYEDVLRSAVLTEGMWDMVRVDHGTEFYLSTFMQEKNQDKRYDVTGLSFSMTQSKQNLKVERMWPEFNERVNYPLKRPLRHMTNSGHISMDHPIDRYCVSNLTMQLASIGMSDVSRAWNRKNLSGGKGIPDVMRETARNSPVTEEDFPPAEEAAQLYADQRGGQLTVPHPFQDSPFPSAEAQAACDAAFAAHVPDLGVLWGQLVNNETMAFQQAILKYVELTRQHSNI